LQEIFIRQPAIAFFAPFLAPGVADQEGAGGLGSLRGLVSILDFRVKKKPPGTLLKNEL
jgi:hypothetical protein